MNITHPQSIEEAGALTAQAAAAMRPVIPAGRLSRLEHSPAVRRPEALVISAARLKTIVSVEPDNLLAVVEAGLTPDELDAALAPTGLYWPVSGLGRRTLGAIMAEGALGLETMARGAMTDWVLGSSFITAEGRLVESGGRTLKNVAGYDFTRLAWRSFGRLGLCVRFILKLLPRPAVSRTLEVSVEKASEAALLAEAAIVGRLGPEALRIACRPAQTSLLVWLAGFPEVVEAREAQLREMAPGRVTVREGGPSVRPESGRAAAFMGRRRAVLDLAARFDGGVPGVRGADLDVGGGRAYLEFEDGCGPDHARLPGLVPDRFTPSGLVYERLKKGLDPGDIFFPDKLLQ